MREVVVEHHISHATRRRQGDEGWSGRGHSLVGQPGCQCERERYRRTTCSETPNTAVGFPALWCVLCVTVNGTLKLGGFLPSL
jgi:hypothetical protein